VADRASYCHLAPGLAILLVLLFPVLEEGQHISSLLEEVVRGEGAGGEGAAGHVGAAASPPHTDNQQLRGAGDLPLSSGSPAGRGRERAGAGYGGRRLPAEQEPVEQEPAEQEPVELEPAASKERVEKNKKAKAKTQDYYKESLENDEDFSNNTVVKDGAIVCSEDGCDFRCVEEDEYYARGHRSKHRKQMRKAPVKRKQKEILCNICKSVFSDHKHLDKHYREEHALATYQCFQDGCNKTFLQKFRFNEHVNSHNKVNCNKCNKKYGRQSDLNRHMKVVHMLTDSDFKKKVESLKKASSHIEEWKVGLEDVKINNCPKKIILFCEEFLVNFPMCEDVWLLLLQTLSSQAAGRNRIIPTYNQVTKHHYSKAVLLVKLKQLD
jgi:hypothetical protein